METKTQTSTAALLVGGEERWLNRQEAADYLKKLGFKISPATLAKMAVTGDGPPFVKFGRLPLYGPPGLRAWGTGRCTPPLRSTSAAAAVLDDRHAPGSPSADDAEPPRRYRKSPSGAARSGPRTMTTKMPLTQQPPDKRGARPRRRC